MEKNTAIVRVTKSGNVIWFDAETKNREIAAQLIREGYDLQMTPEKLGKVKYLVVSSSITYYKRIYSGFRTEKQKERFLMDWNRYDHLHDRMEVITKTSVEYNAIRRILGPDANFYLIKF